MTQSAAIASLLGGQKVLRRAIQQDTDLEQVVLEGLPAQALRTLAQRTEMTLMQLQDVTSIDRATFARRARGNARLKTDESDRVVRVARVAALAIDAMGKEDGLAWLLEKNDVLGQRVPLHLLETDVGARQVENILGRIVHGVYS